MRIQPAIQEKFDDWYGVNNPDCPEDLKPIRVNVYSHCPYGSTVVFVSKIKKTNELQIARVFMIGETAEISLDHVFKLSEDEGRFH